MKRLTMRKIREALRLHASGLSTRKIAGNLAGRPVDDLQRADSEVIVRGIPI
jgi:hypothetical protein